MDSQKLYGLIKEQKQYLWPNASCSFAEERNQAWGSGKRIYMAHLIAMSESSLGGVSLQMDRQSSGKSTLESLKGIDFLMAVSMIFLLSSSYICKLSAN